MAKRKRNRVLDEEKRIEKLERKILKNEGRIEKELSRKEIKKLIKEGGMSGGLHAVRHVFIGKLARHKFLFTIIVVLGIVLVWRGIWEVSATLPFLSISGVALVVGLIILWLIEKYTNLG